jgi:outer membrane lipoprotein-sorting protein
MVSSSEGSTVLCVTSLRSMSTRRLLALIAGVVAAAGGGTAIAVAGGDGPTPPAKPLDAVIHDAATAPAVDGITAKIQFTNHLIDASSLQGSDPILSGASGRLWLGSGHKLRLELQSDSGDAQIVSDGKTVTVYDATMNTAYRADLPQDPTATDPNPDQPPTLASIQADLKKLAQHWNISGATPTAIAGQPAYSVRISPSHDGGLLGAAELAADANTGVPLRAAIYAAGDSSPVLELQATHISYGKVDSSVFDVAPPAGAKVTDFTPKTNTGSPGTEPKPVTGAAAVGAAVPFTLTAPDKLVGLPRHEVRLIDAGDHPAALVTYGAGLGGIAVVEQAADPKTDQLGPAGKPKEGESGLSLPTVSINGATGQELDTALGTMVRFTRAGVTYTVIGSVPAAAAEAAARGL